MRHSTEVVREIWNDDTGERIDVRTDRDCLELVELVARCSDGKVERSLVMPSDQARAVAFAMLDLCDELEGKSQGQIVTFDALRARLTKVESGPVRDALQALLSEPEK